MDEEDKPNQTLTADQVRFMDFPSRDLNAAIGEVVIWFEELDEMLATSISFILRRGDQLGRAVTAPLSFRAKIDLFGALFRADRPRSRYLDEVYELCKGCLKAEQERNVVVHSRWEGTFESANHASIKFTARAKNGLREVKEPWPKDRFIAAWTECGRLTHEIDELMFYEYGTEYGTMGDDPADQDYLPSFLES